MAELADNQPPVNDRPERRLNECQKKNGTRIFADEADVRGLISPIRVHPLNPRKSAFYSWPLQGLLESGGLGELFNTEPGWLGYILGPDSVRIAGLSPVANDHLTHV